MAVELRNLLQRALGLSLPPTLLFENPTVDALVEFLLDRIVDEPTAPAVPAAPAKAVSAKGIANAPIALPKDLSALSEPELFTLLDAELSAALALVADA
jgi:hypothetical protein